MKKLIVTKCQLDEIVANPNKIVIKGKTQLKTPNDINASNQRSEVLDAQKTYGKNTIVQQTLTRNPNSLEAPVEFNVDLKDPESVKNFQMAAQKNSTQNMVANTTNSNVSENCIRLTKGMLDKFLLTK